MSKIKSGYFTIFILLGALLLFGSCGNQMASALSATSASPIVPPMLPPGAQDPSNWKITEARAIAEASKHVPAEIMEHARIHAGQESYGNLNTGESHYTWSVMYLDIDITQDWLGWQSDNQTELDSLNGKYNEIIVTIDAVTGDFLKREAYYGVSLGPPPGITQVTVIPWTPDSPSAQ